MTSTNIDAAEQIDDFSPTTNTTTGGGGGGGSMKEKKSNSSGVVVDPAAETTFLHGSTSSSGKASCIPTAVSANTESLSIPSRDGPAEAKTER